jgi:hypothetical protein
MRKIALRARHICPLGCRHGDQWSLGFDPDAHRLRPNITVYVGNSITIPSMDLFCAISPGRLFQYRNDPGPPMGCARNSTPAAFYESALIGFSRFGIARASRQQLGVLDRPDSLAPRWPGPKLSASNGNCPPCRV